MSEDSMEPDQPEERTDTVQITTREAIAEVRKTVVGVEAVTQERIRVRPFISQPASVSVKAGMTINLGNFESARVDVMLTMPCYPEEINEVYESTKEWVDGRVTYIKKEIERGIK